jgi:hypothetical protein
MPQVPRSLKFPARNPGRAKRKKAAVCNTNLGLTLEDCLKQ